MIKYLGLAIVLFFVTGMVYGDPDSDSIPRIVEEINVKDLLPLLKLGTVVLIHKDQKGTEFATGIVLIKAPLKKVWDTLLDYDRYNEFVPNVKQCRVLERKAEDNLLIEYALKFSVVGLFDVGINYYLDQYYKKYSEIWGIITEKKKSDFKDVRFREYLIDAGEDNTIFVYTAYADLRSSGFLARIIYDAFPELITPTLVSVGTIFPEAVKERIEGVKLNYNPVEVKIDSVNLPQAISNNTELFKNFAKIPPTYRTVLFHNPMSGGVRFASGITHVETEADQLKKVIMNFENYANFISFIKETHLLNKNNNLFSVKYKLLFKVIVPMRINYTLDYEQSAPFLLDWKLNKKEEHDISGEWGRIEIIPLNHTSSILVYTSFSHLVSTGFFTKMMLKHINGFDMGLRVATTDMVMNAYKRAAETKAH